MLFLLGLVILISWLVLRPQKPTYTIEKASAHNLKYNDTHFNATFNFLIRAHNRRNRVTIYYNPINVTTTLDEEVLGFKTLCPFDQTGKNDTMLNVKIRVQNGVVPEEDTQAWKDSGKIQIDEVILESRVRLKVGIMKLKRRPLKVLCSPVNVTISPPPSKSPAPPFEKVKCKTHLKV